MYKTPGNPQGDEKHKGAGKEAEKEHRWEERVTATYSDKSLKMSAGILKKNASH